MERPKKTLTDAAQLLQLSELLSTNVRIVINEWAKEQRPQASNDGASPASLPSRKLHEAQRTILAITGSLTELVAEPSLRILEVGFQYWESRALYIAAERRIPDLLAEAGGDGVSAKQLGSTTGIEHLKLSRILRCLCSNHIFTEPTPNHFANNVISAALVGNEPLRAYILCVNLDTYAVSEHMPKALLDARKGPSYRVDETAFQDALNTKKTKWEWLEEKVSPGDVCIEGAGYPGLPEPKKMVYGTTTGNLVSRPELEFFSLAMLGAGRVLGAAHPYDYPWSELGDATVVDVGGGVGGFDIQLSRLYPQLKFVIQDRGPVLKQAESIVWPKENPTALAEGRVKFMQHNFFEPNPVRGAEVYWLRSILHDWSDEYCVTILAHLRDALTPGKSRILICDQLMDTTGGGTAALRAAPAPLPANYGAAVRYSHQRDLCMMGSINGIERMPAQLAVIAERAGLRIERVWECRSQVAIVEARLL